MSSTRIRLAALAAALLGALAVAGPAQATDTAALSQTAFSAQARSAGLSSAQANELQRTVDANLAATGGRQVGANKIALGGGSYRLLTLPGEQRARDLDAPRSLAGECPYGYGCLWSGTWFTGNVDYVYECGDRHMNNYTGTGSWKNNQPSKYRMKFYDRSGVLRWTSPGGPSSDPQADWNWVGAVAAC
ncbi:hypothetical protein WDV06_26420 [Streptomyces racemochromogenes]|uniref:Peptidase inhibitor family I36 n=1 Tax=Streptomyces racemochromogenes TaxID=67353 RepID=A0ABW7PJK0_9ACTN